MCRYSLVVSSERVSDVKKLVAAATNGQTDELWDGCVDKRKLRPSFEGANVLAMRFCRLAKAGPSQQYAWPTAFAKRSYIRAARCFHFWT